MVVVIFSVSPKRKKYTCKFILPLLPQYCYGGFCHAFVLSPTTAFYEMEEKTSKLNILLIFFSFLCEGYIVGFFTHSNEVGVSGKFAMWYIIHLFIS